MIYTDLTERAMRLAYRALCANPLARAVKRADLAHNSDESHIGVCKKINTQKSQSTTLNNQSKFIT